MTERIQVHIDHASLTCAPDLTPILERLDHLHHRLDLFRDSLTRKLGSLMDTLADVKAAGLALNIDVDGALDALAERDERADAAAVRITELEAALAEAGVDPAARQEILDMFAAEQAKVAAARDALDPTVPVEEVPPAE